MKTVRFAQVVARSGKPRAHAFWVAPEHDREFLAAQKAGRVMMIAAPTPGKADVGTVGYDKAHAAGAQILIFPKSLRPFEGARVVGVKFDLVQQPSLVAGEPETPPPAHASRHKAHGPSPPQPEARTASSAREPAAPADASPPRTHGRARPPARGQRGGTPARGQRSGAVPKTQSAQSRGASSAPAHRDGDAKSAKLVAEVKAAVAELRAGKAVAAYERLQRALDELSR